MNWVASFSVEQAKEATYMLHLTDFARLTAHSNKYVAFFKNSN